MNVNKSKNIFDGIIKTEINKPQLSYWERSGNSYCYRYDNREISLPKLEPYDNQKFIISETIRIMNEKESKTSVILLSGPPGTGKSTIATFLAKELLSPLIDKLDKVHYIDTFNPTTPGDEFGKIYRKINPTCNSPLIIVLEEIDIIINKIYNNIPDHKYISIQIQNKTGWNIWFDKLDKGFYPHVYIIMTTNKSINYFDELDKSYMRNNRVNLKSELHTDKTFVIL